MESSCASAEFSDWSKEVEVDIKFRKPVDFKYNASLGKFLWDPVQDAILYEVRMEGSGMPFYMGVATECDARLPAGTYRFRVRAGDDAEHWWGEWSEWMDVSIPA